MKKTKIVLTTILLAASTWLAKGQSCSSSSCSIPACEYVCNGGFEFYSTAPSALNQLTLACGWINANSATTPDYFNANATTTIVDVPCNQQGKEPERTTQNGYAGFLSRFVGFPEEERIATQLKSTLQTGKSYEVSFWLSLSETGDSNADGSVGFQFCPSPVYNSAQPLTIINTSSIAQNAWTKMTYTFTETGAYLSPDYLVIGTFTQTPTLYTSTTGASTVNCTGYSWSPTSDEVYYYIDDVSVREITTLTATSSHTAGCAGEVFTLTARS